MQTTATHSLCIAAVMVWINMGFATSWSVRPLTTRLRRLSFTPSVHYLPIHAKFSTLSTLSAQKNDNIPASNIQGEHFGARITDSIRQAPSVEQLSLELKDAKKMIASELAGDVPFTRKTARESLRIFTQGLKRLTQLRDANYSSDAADDDGSAIKVDASFAKLLAELVRIIGHPKRPA